MIQYKNIHIYLQITHIYLMQYITNHNKNYVDNIKALSEIINGLTLH